MLLGNALPQPNLRLIHLNLILRQLTRRFSAIEPEIEQQIRTLPITQLEELAEALLDFNSKSDLVNYIKSG
ncbi:MAG: DUF4351 domain-containing protein [Nostoc sp.]|uniref:DUF4351 domain-containing protein n=1 Tax=Nostoc sp. TaxID=1180 RepID=UPI002FF17DC7